MKHKSLKQISRLCINHWKRNRKILALFNLEGLECVPTITITHVGFSISEKKCAFCKYFKKYNCASCPIWKHTRKSSCNDTPYSDVVNSIYVYNRKLISKNTFEQLKVAVDEEIKFLEMINTNINKHDEEQFKMFLNGNKEMRIPLVLD
jgi:hypothetical protein